MGFNILDGIYKILIHRILIISRVVLAVFATSIAQNIPGKDNCDQIRFNHCNSMLGEYWSIDSSNIWKDIHDFREAILILMKQPYGLNNYINICNGFSNFYACLGQNSIRQCLNTIGLVGSGKSLDDAYSYEGFLADWRFKCGAGFFAVYENVTLSSCTQNTYVNYDNDIHSSFVAYSKNITADPNNACKYSQSLMMSIGSIFQNGPCRASNSEEARWFGCQCAREYTNAQFRHCQHQTTCKVRDHIESYLIPNFEKNFMA